MLIWITPSEGTWNAGTQVSVTIEYCALSGSFDAPGGVQFNGVDVTASFSYGGSGVECPGWGTDWHTRQGTVTLVEGQNTVLAYGYTEFDYGEQTASYTGVVYGVAVTPDGAATPDRATGTNGYTASLTVQNTGNVTTTYNLACSTSGPVTCTGLSAASVQLGGGASTAVNAFYNVGAPGTGTLTLTANSTQGGVSDQGSYSVPVVLPFQVSLAPYNHALQDMGRCAAGCFAATAAVTTVPYFSLDNARSVTLAYHGDRVDPKPFVHADVYHIGTPSLPQAYRFRVRKSDGSYVTFLNGEDLLHFAPQAGWVRVGGQFAAAANGLGATGAYDVTVVVAAVCAGGGVEELNTATKVVVVNENTSPIARGWTVAGIQRLYVQPDGSVLITEGDGSAIYFQKVGQALQSPSGDFSSVVYKATPLPGKYVRTFPDSTEVTFDNTGRMVSVKDRFGTTGTITYDGNGRVWQIRDPLNLTTTLGYGANGLASISDPSSRTTYVTVQADSTLTHFTNLDGIATQFGYDGSRRLSTITDRGGTVTTLGYHGASGKLTSVTAPAVPIHGEGTVSPVTTFDPWQHKGVPYGGTGTPFATPRPDSVRGAVTAPGGATTRFTVNRFGQPLVTSLPYGQWSSVTYNAAGQPLTVTGSAGSSASYGYDGLGQLTSVNDNGRVTTIRYGGWGQPDSIMTPASISQRLFIGANGRVDSVRVGPPWDSVVTRYRYDAYGRPDSIGDPVGHVVQAWYTGVNGNRSADFPLGGGAISYFHDAIGRVRIVMRTGHPDTETLYDTLNRPTHIYDGVNPQPTIHQYDARFLRSLTDPKGQVYGWDYNNLGWVTRRTDPAGARDTIEYNRDGAVMRQTTRRGLQLEMVYDSLLRRLQKTGTPGQTTTESWSYSADGRVITGTSPVSVETIYTNGRGQPDSVKTILAGRTYWRRYVYRANGTLDTVRATATGSGAAFLTRTYGPPGPTGAPTYIQFNGVGTAFSADGHGLPTHVLVSVGPGDSYSVEHVLVATHGVAEIVVNTWAVPFRDAVNRRIGYDVRGHLISSEWKETGWRTRAHSYDDLGRLTGDTITTWATQPSCGWYPEFGWVCPASLAVEWAAEYAYDEVGNRTSQGGQYTPNGSRIQAFANCSYTTQSDGTVASRTCGGTQVTFVWHVEERMAEVQRNGVVVKLHYDAFDRLVRYDSAGVITRHFLWDGGNLFAELDAVGNKLAEFSYYPGLDRLHAFVLASDPTQTFFAQSDAMGNVVALSNQAQAVVRTYKYDAWGQLIGGTDSYGFAGRDRARWKGALWFDLGADVYYMRARWYEVHSGRFLSEDPIGVAGGINPSVYAGANPILGWDPTGLDPCPWNARDRLFDCPPITVTAEWVPAYGLHESSFWPEWGPRAFQACDDPQWRHPQCDDWRPRDLGERGPSCSAEFWGLVASGALDLFSLSGIGKGVVLAGKGLATVGAGALTRTAARTAGTMGFDVAGRRAFLASASAGATAYMTDGVYLAGIGGLQATIAYGPEVTVAAAGGAAGGGITWRDLIPGYGTYKAYRAWRDCRRG